MILRAIDIGKRFYTKPPFSLFTAISFDVERGASVAITGKSGEGKTTLLHILGALESPSSGIVEVCGEKVTPSCAATLRNEHMGFIFQTYNLLEDYTALENVLMPAKIGRKEKSEEGMRLLEEVGLAHRAFLPSKLLSGGEKQRVAIARAFLNDPELIFADEPSGNLDRVNGQIIYDLLLRGSKKRNQTVIIATHDPELASLCDQEFCLSQGRLLLIR